MAKLYKDRKISSWTVSALTEVLTEEWSCLNPIVTKGVFYSKKGTILTFSGEVNIAIEVIKEPHAPEGEMHNALSLSLSPVPFSIETHVLNTFDFHYFMRALPEFSGKRVFMIGKHETWEGSIFSQVTAIVGSIIEEMLNFNRCFDLLTKDTFLVAGKKFDTTNDGFQQYLSRIKAYRLAEIYEHPEKLEDALNAIQESIETNGMAHDNFKRVCESGGVGSWLYTPEMVNRIQAHR